MEPISALLAAAAKFLGPALAQAGVSTALAGALPKYGMTQPLSPPANQGLDFQSLIEPRPSNLDQSRLQLRKPF
jgi:hypothetical protein